MKIKTKSNDDLLFEKILTMSNEVILIKFEKWLYNSTNKINTV